MHTERWGDNDGRRVGGMVKTNRYRYIGNIGDLNKGRIVVGKKKVRRAENGEEVQIQNRHDALF